MYKFKYDLTGKVALVTGGAIGLGNEYVETLAGKGCDVAILDINYEKAAEEAARIQAESGHHVIDSCVTESLFSQVVTHLRLGNSPPIQQGQTSFRGGIRRRIHDSQAHEAF